MSESADPTMSRIDTQIAWYDARSAINKRWYEVLKAVELAAAAAVPLAVLLMRIPWLAAVLGAAVVVIEGVVQLKQFHSNWIGYRSTCEALNHEKYLYLAKAGPYSGSADSHALLAVRVEETVSREHSRWVDTSSHEPRRG